MAGKLSPLKFALNFEIRGVDMYLRLASKTENPLGKKLFYSLAEEEIDHARKVDEIYNSLNQKSGYKSIARGRVVPSIESIMKGFFLKSRSRDIDKGKENISGYKVALELERKSCDIYKKFSENAGSDAEKKFFRYLLSEEKTHLEAVENVYAYLTRTGDWLEEDESRTWNWMNI